ncbi:S1-like domain-containing protein [Escovopsis weberi]|uniref:S1-like domain-containing protein n=1 Tax=Escovopsis weberi TaxID=150374 RepID=A0A0M8N4S0_ESCWE|nr:S1-like domain-containing protein [Escovopsis weberi]
MPRPKRNVLAAAQEALTPPDALEPTQTLVRVLKPEGNNLYTCALPSGKPVVLELAQRFRNTIWVRRGGFALAEGYPLGTTDSRAAGEIINIVRDEKLWRKQAYWPKEFAKSAYDASDEEEEESTVGKMPPSDDDDDDDDDEED